MHLECTSSARFRNSYQAKKQLVAHLVGVQTDVAFLETVALGVCLEEATSSLVLSPRALVEVTPGDANDSFCQSSIHSSTVVYLQ